MFVCLNFLYNRLLVRWLRFIKGRRKLRTRFVKVIGCRLKSLISDILKIWRKIWLSFIAIRRVGRRSLGS